VLSPEILTPDVIALLAGASVGSFVLGYALKSVIAAHAADGPPAVAAEPAADAAGAAAARPEPENGKSEPAPLGGSGPKVRVTAPPGTDRIVFTAPASGRIAAAVRGAAERVRSDKGSASGRFLPAGPVATHDFDQWKDRKLVDEFQDENAELTNLFTLLPGLTKRITEVTKKRELAPLLADMVVRLCIPPPEKVLVFFTAKSGKEFVLAARIGYRDDEVPANLKIPIDCGRIGRSVKKMLPLDQKDFEREHRQDPIQNVDYYWKTEVASPMVHQKEVLGVLSAEGFPSYNKHAKKMIAVSANLGAIAIANAEFVQTIQRLADSDALTGLYNKRYFFQKLEEEMDKARLTGKPLSIFMFDVDHFKKYNDRNGHQAGDEALRITGQILNDRRRETDTVARYGGEEFICILPETPKEGAYVFAESVRKAIESHGYPHGESQPLGRVSISGGVASYPEDAFSGTGLIEVADACLYKAKEAGRNQICKKVDGEVRAG
jgi:diguanylate cyclase (GGDEF)-like protein